MKTRAWFFMGAWRWTCGLPPVPFEVGNMPSLEELQCIQWDEEFDTAVRCALQPIDEEFIDKCKMRMVQGAFRYGTLVDNKDKDASVLFNSMEVRMSGFTNLRDLTLLFDVANFAFIAFYNFRHQGCVQKAIPLRTFHDADTYTHIVRAILQDFKDTKNLIHLVCIFSFCMSTYATLKKYKSLFSVRELPTKKVSWKR